MATVVMLADYDRRIHRLLQECFRSRALVRYLCEALHEAHAPYVVARIIADALSAHAQQHVQQEVSPQTVARLNLHKDPSFERVYRALCERFDDFMSIMASVGMRIVADLAERPTDVRVFRRVAVPKRQGVDGSKETLVSYLRIYQCALAMLLGVHLEA